MQRVKKHLVILFILVIAAFVVLCPYLLGYKEFVFSADMQLQYEQFYEEWIRMVRGFISTRTWPFYSFSTFLGNNFFAAKTYYLTGDIFLPLVMCFKSVNQGLLAETFVLLVLSGYSLSLFLRRFGIKDEKVIVLASLLYSFSGLGSMYVGQYMFHRFYALLPLLLLGVEIYREKNHISFFALITCLLFMQSYYFLFPTCFFLVIYYFFTMVYHEKYTKVLEILLSAVKLILGFFVGFLLSGVFLVPCILYVLNNPRIGAFSTDLVYPLKVYLGYVFSYACAPFNLYSEIPYLFEVGDGGHLTWYSIYSGIITVPFIFSLFFRKKDTKTLSLLVTEVLLTVFALVPVISSVIHGFSEPSFRWMYLIVFFQLLVLSTLMEDKDESSLIKGGICYTGLLLVTIVIGIVTKSIKLSYTEHLLFMAGSVAVLWIYLFMVAKHLWKVITFCGCVECVGMSSLHLYILNSSYTPSNDSLNTDYIRYGEQLNGDSFYRLYVNPDYLAPFSVMNLNQSLHYDYASTVTYDSTYEYDLHDFLGYIDINWHIININDPELLRMLGVKYYYVIDESELPEGYEFTYQFNVNHFMVYKLEDYRPIGYTYSLFRPVSNLKVNKYGKIRGGFFWNDRLIVPDEMDIQGIEASDSIEFELQDYRNDNYLYGHIYNETKQVLFFSIPYSKGWKVNDNGNYLDVYKVQGGFVGVVLEPGDHYLTLTFTPPGFKIGALCTLAGGGLWVLTLLWDILVSKKRREC